MNRSNVKLELDIEPIVKLECLNRSCINILLKKGYFKCNLKYVQIGDTGKCESFLSKSTEAL